MSVKDNITHLLKRVLYNNSCNESSNKNPSSAHLWHRRRWAHRLGKPGESLPNVGGWLSAVCLWRGGKVSPTLIRTQDYPFLDGKLIDLLGLVAWPPWFSKNKIDHQDFLRPRISNLDKTLQTVTVSVALFRRLDSQKTTKKEPLWMVTMSKLRFFRCASPLVVEIHVYN